MAAHIEQRGVSVTRPERPAQNNARLMSNLRIAARPDDIPAVRNRRPVGADLCAGGCEIWFGG